MKADEIIKALPVHFVMLMRNWARGNAGGGLYAISTIYEGFESDRYREVAIPVLIGEVAEVDQALATVQNKYRQAVMLFWQYDGPDMAWLGRRLQVDYRTAAARVNDGHWLLRDALARQTTQAQRYADHARQSAAS